MKIKARILIIAICAVFLAAAGVLAQQNKSEPDATADAGENGTGTAGNYNFGIGGAIINIKDYTKKVEELMQAPTGKMTEEIYLEITARIAACYKGTMLTDNVFNNLKDPYDITSQEYAAYAYRNMVRIAGEIDSGKYDEWVKKYEERKKELEKNGCVFSTNPDGTAHQPCMDADGDDPSRAGTVFYYGETARADNKHYICSPCKYKDECKGDVVIEKICVNNQWDAVEHKCECGCFAGRCLTAEEADQQQCEGQCLETCPAGTVDFDTGGCPKKNGKKNVCCQKAFDKPEASGTCLGSCMKSSDCPEGYENQGTDSCIQEENCYKCGLFNLFTCCDYTKNACCAPKKDAPPIVAPQKCNGYCSAGGCLAGSAAKGQADCAPSQTCKPCGFFGLKKCCEYVSMTCCEYPKPVASCNGGMCTYGDCPSGTMDVGFADCGKVKDCETCYVVAKCCKKKQTKCCMAADAAKCDRGTCQESASCSAGYKNIGVADCGSYQKEHRCGTMGWGICKDPVPKTCCVPE